MSQGEQPHDCKRRIGRGAIPKPRYWLGRNWTRHVVSARNGSYVLFAKRWWGVSIWACIRDGKEIPVWEGCSTYQEVTKVKRRQPSAEVGTVLHLAAVDSTIFGKMLPLVQHCTHTQYEDKTPRKPGWMTIKTMGAAWVVELKDPDSCSRLTVVQQTLDDALTLASVLLESEEAPWEPDPWLKQANAKKKSA